MSGSYCNPNNYWYNLGSHDDPKDRFRFCLYCLLVGIFLALVLISLTSCKSIQYVPVETVKTEYISKTDTFIQKDSVHIKDSVLVFMKGDSVFTDRWHVMYKDRLKEVVKTDTIIKTDSIQVPYPVEKKLTKWQQVKMDAGGMAIGICFIVIIIIFVGFIVKVRSRI